jgi:hypothetical protein
VAFQFENNAGSATSAAEIGKMQCVQVATSRQPNNLGGHPATTKNPNQAGATFPLVTLNKWQTTLL